MKFIVSRTSIWDDDISPYEGAKQEIFTKTFQAAYSNPSLYPGGTARWYGHGFDHTTVLVEGEERIQRSVNFPAWTYEDDILDFIKTVDTDCIVTWKSEHDMFEVEIYDEYRE